MCAVDRMNFDKKQASITWASVESPFFEENDLIRIFKDVGHYLMFHMDGKRSPEEFAFALQAKGDGIFNESHLRKNNKFVLPLQYQLWVGKRTKWSTEQHDCLEKALEGVITTLQEEKDAEQKRREEEKAPAKQAFSNKSTERFLHWEVYELGIDPSKAAGLYKDLEARVYLQIEMVHFERVEIRMKQRDEIDTDPSSFVVEFGKAKPWPVHQRKKLLQILTACNPDREPEEREAYIGRETE
ncbi:hypothetical protein P7C73_g1406, partial [Tremellales sp. Uapishka_1]